MRAGVTEAEFTRQVILLARLHGWRAVHFRPLMGRNGRWRTAYQGDGVGWPDVVAFRGWQKLAAELKVSTRPTTFEQDDWLIHLANAGFRTAVWRPSDWPEIERVLGPAGGEGGQS